MGVNFTFQEIFHAVLDDQGKVPQGILDEMDTELLPLLNVVLPLDLDETSKVRQLSSESFNLGMKILMKYDFCNSEILSAYSFILFAQFLHLSLSKVYS